MLSHGMQQPFPTAESPEHLEELYLGNQFIKVLLFLNPQPNMLSRFSSRNSQLSPTKISPPHAPVIYLSQPVSILIHIKSLCGCPSDENRASSRFVAHLTSPRVPQKVVANSCAQQHRCKACRGRIQPVVPLHHV